MASEGLSDRSAADALDLLPEGVVLLDDAGTVRHANRRAEALLGHAALAGRPLLEAVELTDEGGATVTADRLGLPEVADRLAERLVRVELDDGRSRPLSVTGSRVAGGLLLTFRSAARRVRLDAARSDLVATVSHEIRSPLASVKGFTRTMLAKWERFSDEQKHAMLETINADADRVTRLLTELLDVSRIDAGRVQLQPQRIDVGDLIRRVVDKVDMRAEDDGRDISLEAEGGLPEILADPDKVEQILTNLIENALNHAPGSPVRVRAEAAGVDDGDGGAVVLSVADDGPGISEEQQRRIFRKFGRGGQRRAGTGLGLYITRGLAEAHGGRAWVESRPGEGSTFHVLLPSGGPGAARSD